MPQMRFVSATELRDRLREHILWLGSAPIVIVRHGRAVAVMLSVPAWDRVQDELDDLHDEIQSLEALVAKHGLDRLGRPADDLGRLAPPAHRLGPSTRDPRPG